MGVSLWESNRWRIGIKLCDIAAICLSVAGIGLIALGFEWLIPEPLRVVKEPGKAWSFVLSVCNQECAGSDDI